MRSPTRTPIPIRSSSSVIDVCISARRASEAALVAAAEAVSGGGTSDGTSFSSLFFVAQDVSNANCRRFHPDKKGMQSYASH